MANSVIEHYGLCIEKKCKKQAIEPFGFCHDCKTKCKKCGAYSEKQNYSLCFVCEYHLSRDTKH